MKQIVKADHSGVWIREGCPDCDGTGIKKYGILSIFKKKCPTCDGCGMKSTRHDILVIQGGEFSHTKINNIIVDCEKYFKQNPKSPKGAIFFGNIYKLEFRQGRVREDVLAGLSYLLNMMEINERLMKEMGAVKKVVKQ